FDLPYCFETDTSLLWWSTNYTGWLYGKRRQRLSLSRIQAMAQVRSYYISNINKELDFFGKKLSFDDLQEQVVSATFVIEEDESITEDFEIEEAECDNLEIIERFDIENIVCLKDEIFQDGESDTDSEGSYDVDPNEFDQFNNDKLVVSNKIGQGVFDFDPADLAADLMKEWSYEDDNYSLII
ncbi:30438_t:CDS:2, partial [Gigaspora margarita]